MTVTHNAAARRFEAAVEGGTAVLAYDLRDDGTAAFTHTEVPDAAGGKGVGTALVEAGLAWARKEGHAVAPLCPFVAAHMQGRPETHDLLSDAERKWLDPDYDERA